jgi:uncharacterized protein YdbL (DUF1318 family)
MKLNPKPPASLHKFKSGFIFGALALLVACVTVNVNFPESAVQKASDDYVRDLYRSKEQSKVPSPKTSATPTGNSALLLPRELFQWAVPSALADDLQLNMSSPKIAEIKNKMRAAVPEVIEQKKAGLLGETFDGKIVIHSGANIKPLLKKRLEDLVRDDNTSRESLYAEVVRSNHLPSENLISVKKTFARSFQAESPSGTWVQNADGSWTQKP